MSVEAKRNSDLPPDIVAKASGAMLAHAAGDALGWPQEIPKKVVGKSVSGAAHIDFVEWVRIGPGRYPSAGEVILAGEYSDDTQLMLAVARCRAKYGRSWWQAFTKLELPLWTIYERGGGSSTKRSALGWAKGRPPWHPAGPANTRKYLAAGGNGVAMRAIPHALFFAQTDHPVQLIHDVVLDGFATHGHPRALIGATVFAFAAWSLLRKRGTLAFGELIDRLIDGEPAWGRFPDPDLNTPTWLQSATQSAIDRYRRIWGTSVREMLELLELARMEAGAGSLANDQAVLKNLGCFGKTKGSGTASAAAAAYLTTRYAAQPVQGVLAAAFEVGTDTDTLAAMTGGLMGCLAGSDWIPGQWSIVQDAQYISRLGEELIRGLDQRGAPTAIDQLVPGAIISELIAGQENEIDLGGGRPASVTYLGWQNALGDLRGMRGWQLESSEGQTFYVSRPKRRSNRTRLSKPAHSTRPTMISGPAAKDDPAANDISEMEGSWTGLYLKFLEQLESELRINGNMRTSEIESTLDITRSQSKRWLTRAATEGRIRRSSKRPVKWELRGPSLFGQSD